MAGNVAQEWGPGKASLEELLSRRLVKMRQPAFHSPTAEAPLG